MTIPYGSRDGETALIHSDQYLAVYLGGLGRSRELWYPLTPCENVPAVQIDKTDKHSDKVSNCMW